MEEGNSSKTIDKKDYHVEEQEKNLRYPYSVFFIICNEFCERFCFYGMRSILTIYLVKILFFDDRTATQLYHTFTMLVYFFPLIGAIISDSFLGKFRTIFYVSIIYAIGCITLSISSITPLHLPTREFSLLGLFLIAIGTGGIKPCVSAFGGDQFTLPQQATLLATFFSLFYFSINAGSLLSTFLTPILREDVHCFGKESCFPLAFGVPGILMILSLIIFGVGRPLYRVKKPEGNIVLKVVKCVGNAVKNKMASSDQKEHWLDHSTKKYGEAFVNDVKATLKVLVLYTPLPIFWALYDQQGTAWTFQAIRMNGDIGFYTILPDQFQVVNPLLILLFIPLFQYIIYPLLAKCNLLTSPLEKMIWGGFLAALAFVVSATVSLSIEATDPILPENGFAQLRFYNPLPCPVKITNSTPCSLKEDLDIIQSMTYSEILDVKIKNHDSRDIDIQFEATCISNPQSKPFTLKNKKLKLVVFTTDGLNDFDDDISKDLDSGFPFIRTLMNKGPQDGFYEVKLLSELTDKLTTFNNTVPNRISLQSKGKYVIQNSNNIIIEPQLGGVYTLLVQLDDQNKVVEAKLFTVTEPNSIHMLWLLPQYIIITAAEILFSVTGLEFSYSQAPVTMKSVLTAAFLLTDAVGNLLVVFIEALKFFDKASYEFFLYTGLMVLDMLIFAFLASRYKYIDFEERAEENHNNDTENNFVINKNGDILPLPEPVLDRSHNKQ